MFKNLASQKIAVFAYDTVNETPKTGDAANITAQISLDGAATAATNDVNPTELDATDAPGIYLFDMAQAETNAGLVLLSIASSTNDIVIDPVIIYPVITDVNIISISGDTTSADNLELQYDGNGLAGDTFPATQAQILNIANTGNPTSTPAVSYTLTTGVQSANLFSDTKALNGTRHIHTDTAGLLVLEYVFNIGSGTPSEVVLTGAVNGNNDDLEVLAFDYVASDYVQIGTLEGKNSSANEVDEFTLFTSMVGTGASLGEIKIKFQDGGLAVGRTLFIDQIYIGFTASASGYELGAIWVNGSASNTNTVPNVDGVATNPVSTWAAALTLSALTNIEQFHISSGSSIQLTANSDAYTLFGFGYTVDLNGQSVSGANIDGAMITGNDSGTNAIETHYFNCEMGDNTLGIFHLNRTQLAGDLILAEAGTYLLDSCYSGVAGTDTPSIDFQNAAENKNLNARHNSGGIEFKNFGHAVGIHKVSLEGWGQYIFNVNCSAATASDTLAIRGSFTETDNVVGGWDGTISDDARYDVTQIAGTVPTVTQITADMDANSTQFTAIVLDTGTTIPDTITTLQSTIDDVETDTQDIQVQIGTAGLGLSNLGGMSTAMKAEVNIEADTALTDYDSSTRAENISDRNDIITQVNANEAKIDTIGINVDQIETAVITNAADTDISADIANVKSVVDLTLTDTGTTIPVQISAHDSNLNGYLANGGTTDVLIDSIIAKTSSLTFTVAAKLDTNAYLIEAVDATNQLDAHGGTANTTSLDAITDLLEADSEIDVTTNVNQATLNYTTKGTSTVILKKDLKQSDGTPVTAVTQRIAKEEDVAL